MKSQLEHFVNVVFSNEICCSVDGILLTDSDISTIKLFPWKIESTNPWWCRLIKAGEVGFLLSHYSCWEYALNYGLDLAIFLENDVTLSDDWYLRVNILVQSIRDFDSDWDLIYLGRERLEDDQMAFGNFCIPGMSYCTHAYMLSSGGMKKLVQSNIKENIMPIDEYLPATYACHGRSDVMNCVDVVLAAYSCITDIIPEPDGSLFGSETENTEDISTT